jgi:hypothetical protein
MRSWSSLVMTWASQAYNPGSNPGDRTFYTPFTPGQTQVQKKQQIKNRYDNDFAKKEGEVPDSVSLLTTLNVNSTSHIFIIKIKCLLALLHC